MQGKPAAKYFWFKHRFFLQARLRLDRRTSNVERHNIVSELLVQVGLAESANTLIGKSGQDKVLSGGEQKRLAFATEVQIRHATEGPMTL
jgi:ABC-type glutathione transport system ATPase component